MPSLYICKLKTVSYNLTYNLQGNKNRTERKYSYKSYAVYPEL